MNKKLTIQKLSERTGDCDLCVFKYYNRDDFASANANQQELARRVNKRFKKNKNRVVICVLTKKEKGVFSVDSGIDFYSIIGVDKLDNLEREDIKYLMDIVKKAYPDITD